MLALTEAGQLDILLTDTVPAGHVATQRPVSTDSSFELVQCTLYTIENKMRTLKSSYSEAQDSRPRGTSSTAKT